ncbi:MAG: hypothetical protein U0236_10270 [Nitrospira sp.]
MKDRVGSNTGVLSVIAAALLFAVPSGFAADQPPKGSGSVELKAKPTMPTNLNVKDLDEEVSHLEVVDSKGNAYLLIPLKTAGGNKPVVTDDGKIIVEYVHPYTGRLGN